MATIKSTVVTDNRINANVSPPSKIVPKQVVLHDVTALHIGLGNVDNTSDINKPVSTATQTALDLKANQSTTYTKTEVDSNITSVAVGLADHTFSTNNPHSVTATQVSLGNVTDESKATMFTDPTFTGNPQSNAAPTSNDHLTNKNYVDTQVAGVVDSAPEALDTLNELADALGDDQNFATTTATSIGEKLAKASNLSDLANATTARSNLGLGNVTNESKATMFTGAVFTGDLTVDTNTLKVDSTNNRVGIGTATPGTPLAVVGASTFNGTVKIPTQNAAFIKQKCFFKSGGVRLQHAAATTDEMSMRYEGANPAPSGQTLNSNFIIQQIHGNANKGAIKFIPSTVSPHPNTGQSLIKLDGQNVDINPDNLTRLLSDTSVASEKKLTFLDTRTQADGLHFEHSGNNKVIQMGRYDSYPSATEGDFKITSKFGNNSVQDILTIDQSTNYITLHERVYIESRIYHASSLQSSFGFTSALPAASAFDITTSNVKRLICDAAGLVTISGNLQVDGNVDAATAPTTGNHLTNKTYVDAQVAVNAQSISDVNSDLVTASAEIDTKAPINNPSFTGDSTNFSGLTNFDKKVKITPESGLGLQLFSSGSNNAAVSLQVQGPTTVGHDLFQRSGFTGGFGDGSNHFHSLIDINRIEQEAEGDVKNTQRVQERYYAIQDNFLPNDKAVFWAQHRVARPISTTVIDTSTATLNVSLLQNSTNRSADNQAFFVSNTTPLNKSEELEITLNGHTLSTGDSVRMEFGQAFVGPIVAAQIFGKVTTTTTNTFKVELYGGNYKTTSEVPLGTSQTALTFDHVILETIGTNTIVQSGNETDLQLYSKTNFTPNRLKDETLKATWSVAHGLVKNEHCTLITDGRGDLVIKQAAYVLDPDPDSDGLSVILVYGRRIKQFDLGSFTAFGSSNWTLHKGSIDGIHDDTLGDNLINFNANNHGDYTAYQIGPGSQTDADCIAIGKNVYNKDASTIKIGYDNAMLDVRSDGVVIAGTIDATGTITGDLTTQSIAGETSNGSVAPIVIEGGTCTSTGALGGGTLVLEGGESPNNTAYHGSVVIGPFHTGDVRIGQQAVTTTQVFGEFRVDSDTNANPLTLKVDTANDRVGINKDAPTEALDVVGNIIASGSVNVSTAPTSGNHLTNKTYVDTQVAGIVDSAPAALDTLNELAAALGDDASFATTTATSIGHKLAKASNLSDLADAATARTNLGLGTAATTASSDYATAAQGTLADNALAASAVSTFGGTLIDDADAATARTTLGLGNVTNESKSTMFTSPSFTGTISSSGLLDFGHRTSNDVIIRAESDSHDITLIRAAANVDTVGVSLKYIGSGSGDENIFEIETDGGGSLKIDNSGDVGINTAPVDGIDLAVGTFTSSGSVGIGISAPLSKLHVRDTSAGNLVRQLRISNESDNDGTGAGIIFNMTQLENPQVPYVNAAIDSLKDSQRSGNLVFSTRETNTGGNDAVIERMRINGSGEVGIGKTATAGVELDVQGDIAASGSVSTNTITASSNLNINAPSHNISLSSGGTFGASSNNLTLNDNGLSISAAAGTCLAINDGPGGTDFINASITTGKFDVQGVVHAKGYSLNANTFTVVSTTSTLAASTNGLTVILQNTGPITITLPTLAAGHVTTFISETNNAVTFVGDTGITVNSFGGNNTTAGIFAQCQVIYKTTTVAFLGGNLV